MNETFPVHYDYSETTFGGMPNPSADTAVKDEYGRWRIAVGGDPDQLLQGAVYPTKDLANNRIARRQATYDADWKRLHRLEAEADELRQQ